MQETITELRRLMQESKDLSEIFVYFDDHLGSKDDFHRLGSPVPNEPLVNVARAIVKGALSLSLVPPRPLTFLAEHQLWHGTMYSEQGMAVVVYFSDIDRGVCCVMHFAPPMQTNFLRFSMPEGTSGDFDPDLAEVVSMARRSPGGDPN